jgi:glutaredoxin
VKEFFTKHAIFYTVYDVSKDTEARKRLTEELGERSVPVIMVGKTKIVGYNEEQLKKAFNIS